MIPREQFPDRFAADDPPTLVKRAQDVLILLAVLSINVALALLISIPVGLYFAGMLR